VWQQCCIFMTRRAGRGAARYRSLLEKMACAGGPRHQPQGHSSSYRVTARVRGPKVLARNLDPCGAISETSAAPARGSASSPRNRASPHCSTPRSALHRHPTVGDAHCAHAKPGKCPAAPWSGPRTRDETSCNSSDISGREAQLGASDYPEARARVDKSVVVAPGPVTSPIGTEILARLVELGCGAPSTYVGATAKVAWTVGLGTNVLVAAAGKTLLSSLRGA
jgi:hypothetical protein